MSWSAVRAWLAAPVPLPPHPIKPSFRGLLLGEASEMKGVFIEAELTKAAVPDRIFLLLRFVLLSELEFLAIYIEFIYLYILS
jgi:hypothetical protein